MSRKKKRAVARASSKAQKQIKYWSDYQQDWEALIPTLRHYSLEQVNFLSITGDAPKDFVTDSEYRPGHRSRRQRRESYIAKVGSKFYPNESIVEQLMTRKNIEKFLSDTPLKKSLELLDKEFGALMSAERCELIKRCLHLRQQRLLEAVNQFR